MNLHATHYQCGVPGCDEARIYAAGIDRKVSARIMRDQGWEMYLGECRCPKHSAERLEQDLRASLGVQR